MYKKSFKPTFSPSRLRPKVTSVKHARGALVPRPSRFGSTDSTSVNVKVCVRVRPPNERESETNKRIVVKAIDKKMLIFDPKEEEEQFFYHNVMQPTPSYIKKSNKEMQFMFDHIFDVSATNVDVFNESTKDVINSLMEGYNCSVFVYGATGAGKTYTMLGYPENPGITYLTMRELFNMIEMHRHDREFEICVSYLEIYNENVHDLLQPSGPLHLREDNKYGVQVAGLYSKSINTAQELLDMLEKGNKNRTQHPTDANSESSRSHAVFQVYVKIRTKATNQAKIVKLSMIDLAGSERASATGCKGDRFKEGANINRSLLALGNCINQLADGSKFIPYRDSKMTRLLKDSLGGNCRTVMIANVGPTCSSYEDTYNTLKYATRANKIQQRMKKNIVNCDNHVAQYVKQAEELTERVAQLEAELAKAKANVCETVVTHVSVGSDNDKVVQKWHNLLTAKGDAHFTLLRRVLNKQKKQRGFAARAARKYRATLALANLCSDVSDAQLEEACNKDINRLKLSSETLIRQSRMVEEELEPLVEKLKISEEELTSLQKEALSANESLQTFIYGQTFEENSIISDAKAEHLYAIANLQQDEIEKHNSFVKDALNMLKKNYLRLKSQKMFTSVMEEEYNSLIRQAKNSRAITWQDDVEKSSDSDIAPNCDHLINLDPFEFSKVPEMIKENIVISPFDATSIHVIENAAKNETMILDDSDDDLNVTYIEDSGKESILMNGSDIKTINPAQLNSTFVLNNKVEGEGEPVAKKPFVRTELKKVLLERTNMPLSAKVITVKPKLPINKVAPLKKPLIHVNNAKENIRSGFGSTADRFGNLMTPAATVQVGCKTVRVKERVGLQSASGPYKRPALKPVKR